MYVSIDCDNMKFLRKHPDLPSIANLAWIENQDTSMCISSITDAGIFRDFTLMELQMLYRNTTKLEPHQDVTEEQLSQILYDIAERLPEADIRVFELDIQARFVKEGDLGPYQYCKGATKPSSKIKLFGPEFITANKDLTEELSALAGKTPAVDRAKIRKPAGTGSNRKGGSISTMNNNAKAPARGTAKAIIWETADFMWTEDGEPKDKKLVLALRKKIMDSLEGKGVKRASASSELGKWHKDRIPD